MAVGVKVVNRPGSLSAAAVPAGHRRGPGRHLPSLREELLRQRGGAPQEDRHRDHPVSRREDAVPGAEPRPAPPDVARRRPGPLRGLHDVPDRLPRPLHHHRPRRGARRPHREAPQDLRDRRAALRGLRPLRRGLPLRRHPHGHPRARQADLPARRRHPRQGRAHVARHASRRRSRAAWAASGARRSAGARRRRPRARSCRPARPTGPFAPSAKRSRTAPPPEGNRVGRRRPGERGDPRPGRRAGPGIRSSVVRGREQQPERRGAKGIGALRWVVFHRRPAAARRRRRDPSCPLPTIPCRPAPGNQTPSSELRFGVPASALVSCIENARPSRAPER